MDAILEFENEETELSDTKNYAIEEGYGSCDWEYVCAEIR